MTDNFLQKLEEKVMVLLTELEVLRKEHTQLKQENANLKLEKQNHAKKLQGLISLLDSLEATVEDPSHVELELIQGKEEYATA
jgi:regulator of replication initiation timing